VWASLVAAFFAVAVGTASMLGLRMVAHERRAVLGFYLMLPHDGQ